MILLNPGPVTLTERVRAAQTGPDLCHREPEFGDLQQRVLDGLLAVYGLPVADWQAVLVSGSGTAAVEAMIASLVPSGASLVTVENGVYGERLTAIARAHGIAVTPVTAGWGEGIDTAALESAVAAIPGPVRVAVVHHETTTGRLNDLDAVAAICRTHDASMLIDAVSSFAGEPISFDQWPIAACAATANKCLHGVPGAACVISRRWVLADAARPARTVYLDLAAHAQAQAARSTAFTPAVPALYALAAALDELAEQGGWQARHARYRELAERLHAGLVRLGVMPWLDPADSSVVLRSYRLPPDMAYETLHAELKSRGFIVYAGQAGLANELFRLSTMGAIDDAAMDRLLAAFARIFT